MAKVVSIDRGKFLRYYIPLSKFETVLEEAFFVLGVLGTLIVPQVVYCVMGGPVMPWVFIVSAQAGVIVGLVKYIRPATFASIVDAQTESKSRNDTSRRRKLS